MKLEWFQQMKCVYINVLRKKFRGVKCCYGIPKKDKADAQHTTSNGLIPEFFLLLISFGKDTI